MGGRKAGEVKTVRKCLRCGAEMEEGYTITSGYGIVIRPPHGNKGAKPVKPGAAVCPVCGEVSIYLEEKQGSLNG